MSMDYWSKEEDLSLVPLTSRITKSIREKCFDSENIHWIVRRVNETTKTLKRKIRLSVHINACRGSERDCEV